MGFKRPASEGPAARRKRTKGNNPKKQVSRRKNKRRTLNLPRLLIARPKTPSPRCKAPITTKDSADGEKDGQIQTSPSSLSADILAARSHANNPANSAGQTIPALLLAPGGRMEKLLVKALEEAIKNSTEPPPGGRMEKKLLVRVLEETIKSCTEPPAWVMQLLTGAYVSNPEVTQVLETAGADGGRIQQQTALWSTAIRHLDRIRRDHALPTTTDLQIPGCCCAGREVSFNLKGCQPARERRSTRPERRVSSHGGQPTREGKH